MTGKVHEDPRRVLARHGFAPKRSFSQNFLVSQAIVDRIAGAVPAASGTRVVEFGPGAGTLTAALTRRGFHVLAVERDRDMVALIRSEFAESEVSVVEGDAASVDLAALQAAPVHVVGNLPYAITGAILRHLVESRGHVASAVVMVQKEVRDRLLADPGDGDYGALTVFTGAAFAVEPVCIVAAGNFHPPPKVDSAVVRLVPHAVPRAAETVAFRRVVRAAFEQRRKMLRASLRTLAAPEVLAAAFATTGIAPEERPERLAVEDFARLAAALGESVA